MLQTPTSFLFPPNRHLFERIHDVYEIRSIIKTESLRYPINFTLHSCEMKRGRRSYIYVKCLPCKKMTMRLIKENSNPDPFRMLYFDNTHIHGPIVETNRHKNTYNISEIF